MSIKKFAIVILAVFAFFVCAVSPAMAGDTADVRAFFDKFVKDYNSYDPDVTDYFTSDAKIIRVVIKPDGTEQSVTMPLSRYRVELIKGRLGAKLIGYKNDFSNIHITNEGSSYKLTATRTPNKGGGGLSCYYIIVKTADGYKIQTESWTTEQQGFLKKGS